MNRLRRQMLSAVVWATIPFVLASGMPRVGCVCVNGDHRPFCQGYQSPSAGQTNACSAGSDCECCPSDKAPDSSTSKSTRPCCGKSTPAGPAGVASSGRCCQPYLILPSVVKNIVVAQAPANDENYDWQPVASTLAVVAAEIEIANSPRPPPDASGVDLLHLCCVLVI